MKDKAVVISIDAMTQEDLGELGRRRNTSSLLSSSSLVREMETAVPSYTYPCHAAIITGCCPDGNGIYHNEIFTPERIQNDWFWWGWSHRRKTIIDAADEHGLVTASVSWPTLAGGNALYTIPEIWPIKTTENIEEMYRKAVSKEAWPVFEEVRPLLLDRTKPFYDLYTTSASERIIRSHRPDLILIHLSEIDHVKHAHGSDRSVLSGAYDFIDDCLGRIIAALKDTGEYDGTTFFLLGDHGQKNIERVFSINRVLSDMGYITVSESGRVEDYRIIVHPAAFTAEVYLRGITEDDAVKVFEDIQKEYPGTIKRILRSGEAGSEYRLSGPFSLVLVSEGGLIFHSSLTFPPLMDRAEADARNIQKSTHGYTPSDGPLPPFAVCGRRAEAGKVIRRSRLVDEGPTILSLFGISMENTDGKVISGLIR